MTSISYEILKEILVDCKKRLKNSQNLTNDKKILLMRTSRAISNIIDSVEDDKK